MKTAATAKIVTPVLIEELLRKATENPRKRAHYNLHDSLEDLIQRLCIATRLGTYFRPHRHTPPATWELFVVLRGAAAFLIFDDIEQQHVLITFHFPFGCARRLLDLVHWNHLHASARTQRRRPRRQLR